ncbi:Contactin-associated protein like 5-2 [Gossypium australe]|uniref:Contactin-associated protein like 5-2 n=1 Tax=Gossypium australe TaxID=47621 RepID=A0A5B6UC86_9ROSI|nr:Contactin-associated protein like 5-2 [Gossypium australe]
MASPSTTISDHLFSIPILTAFRHARASAAKAEVTFLWVSEHENRILPSSFLATIPEVETLFCSSKAPSNISVPSYCPECTAKNSAFLGVEQFENLDKPLFKIHIIIC